MTLAQLFINENISDIHSIDSNRNNANIDTDKNIKKNSPIVEHSFATRTEISEIILTMLMIVQIPTVSNSILSIYSCSF